jgi:hypothetical protein
VLTDRNKVDINYNNDINYGGTNLTEIEKNCFDYFLTSDKDSFMLGPGHLYVGLISSYSMY